MGFCSLVRISVQLLLFTVLTIFITQLFFVNAGHNTRKLGGRLNDLRPPPGPNPGRVRHMIPPEIPPKLMGSPPPPSYYH